jgi:hypothetical protein
VYTSCFIEKHNNMEHGNRLRMVLEGPIKGVCKTNNLLCFSLTFFCTFFVCFSLILKPQVISYFKKMPTNKQRIRALALRRISKLNTYFYKCIPECYFQIKSITHIPRSLGGAPNSRDSHCTPFLVRLNQKIQTSNTKKIYLFCIFTDLNIYWFGHFSVYKIE